MAMNSRIIGIAAAAGAFFAVLLGAFGAHALKHQVSDSHLAIWQTAVQYQMFHSLALLVLSVLPSDRKLNFAAGLMALGTLVFSGSLYLLVLTGQSLFGAITPLGGLAFLAGWLVLLVRFVRQTTAWQAERPQPDVRPPSARENS